MDFYQKELSKIMSLLKENSKGMTVTDISRKIHTNRNSVAKYLDILLILGHVQMITFGPAKVFFPSKRIPVKSLLNFTNDSMILFDENLTITNVNQNLENLLSTPKESLKGESLKHTSLPLLNDQTTISHIQNALEGKTSEDKIQLNHKNIKHQITIKHIPTAYDDGKPGVACIITDQTEITQLQQHNQKMELQLKSTLSTIKDHLFIINNDFTIQKMSHTLAEILSLPSHEIIGKKCYEILHGTDSPPPYCPHITDSLKETKKLTFYEPHLQKTIQLKISPLIDDQGSCHGSVNILNITKQ